MLGGEGWPISRESTRDHRKGGLDRMGQARNCEGRCVGLMIQSSSDIYLDKGKKRVRTSIAKQTRAFQRHQYKSVGQGPLKIYMHLLLSQSLAKALSSMCCMTDI